MFLVLIIFDPDSICANHNIIVVCILGEFSVEIGDLHIEAGGVLDRECLKVELAKDVNILAIDITHRHLEYLLLGLAHSINLLRLLYIKYRMEWVRTGMRVMGRILIFSLLALLITSRWMHPEGIKNTYVSGYENFRQMGMVKRMFILPLSRHIPEFFEVLMWVDLSYEIVTGLLILFGSRFGGWMLFFWNLVKIAVCYSPYLMNAPRLPFTHHQRFDIVRNFAILGVSLALTHIYKPYDSKPKQEEAKSS